jgi:hypothetical protein
VGHRPNAQHDAKAVTRPGLDFPVARRYPSQEEKDELESRRVSTRAVGYSLLLSTDARWDNEGAAVEHMEFVVAQIRTIRLEPGPDGR